MGNQINQEPRPLAKGGHSCRTYSHPLGVLWLLVQLQLLTGRPHSCPLPTPSLLLRLHYSERAAGNRATSATQLPETAAPGTMGRCCVGNKAAIITSFLDPRAKKQSCFFPLSFLKQEEHEATGRGVVGNPARQRSQRGSGLFKCDLSRAMEEP